MQLKRFISVHMLVLESPVAKNDKQFQFYERMHTSGRPIIFANALELPDDKISTHENIPGLYFLFEILHKDGLSQCDGTLQRWIFCPLGRFLRAQMQQNQTTDDICKIGKTNHRKFPCILGPYHAGDKRLSLRSPEIRTRRDYMFISSLYFASLITVPLKGLVNSNPGICFIWTMM